MSIMLSGLLLGLSLIVAIGPQNILLIRQGVRREGVTAVVIVCILSDVLLFTGGTLGVGVIVEHAPLLLTVLKWAGVAYLGWFALVALRDAFVPRGVTVVDSDEPREQSGNDGTPHSPSGATTVATRSRTGLSRLAPAPTQQRAWVRPMWMAIALTWLNPAAYLDSLVMIGGVANQYGETLRWLFAGGALLASLIWFPVVGYGARLLSGPLSSRRVWRVLNVVIGVVLAVIAVQVALQ